MLKVGGINETTEAKATNLAVTLSSVALGATYTAAAGDAIILTPDGANATLELKGEDDWLERGFSEGDKITITCTQNADWNKNSYFVQICFQPSFSYDYIDNFPSRL